MKLLGTFFLRRLVRELKGVRTALERIAECQERAHPPLFVLPKERPVDGQLLQVTMEDHYEREMEEERE